MTEALITSSIYEHTRNRLYLVMILLLFTKRWRFNFKKAFMLLAGDIDVLPLDIDLQHFSKAAFQPSVT